jgi:predicted nucleic acid-binding protein
MVKYAAVIDNTVLVNLTYLKDLHIFHDLRSVFSRIHIPMMVRTEYEKMSILEPDRVWMLERLQTYTGFYVLCTRYDTVVLNKLKTVPGIDSGEAEVAAQHERIETQYILSDDRAFQTAIKKMYPAYRILGTLDVIALLDLSFVLRDRDKILTRLFNRHRFDSKGLREAYSSMARHLGLHLRKKDLSAKTSIKSLGLVSGR